MTELTGEIKSGAKTKGQDVFGLILSGIGGLFAVSIVLSLGDRQPKEVIWTVPVVGLMNAIGTWPALLFAAATAALGTFSFLRQSAIGIGRHLVGVACLALGLAVLCGSFSLTAGGALGSALPSVLSGTPGVVTAAVLGLAVMAVAAWATWLADGVAVRTEAAVAPRKAPRPATPARDLRDGVSAAEAAALVPDKIPSVAEHARGPNLEDDVRIGGGVPAGTRPLSGSVAAPARRTAEEEADDEEGGWDRIFEESAKADTVPVVGTGAGPQSDEPLATRASQRRAPMGPTTAAPDRPNEYDLIDETEEPERIAAGPLVASWETIEVEPELALEDAPVPRAETPEPEPELAAELEWESEEEIERAIAALELDAEEGQDEEAGAEVAEAAAEVVPAPVPPAVEPDLEPDPELDPAPAVAKAKRPAAPAWEQVGLFDDQEAADEARHEPVAASAALGLVEEADEVAATFDDDVEDDYEEDDDDDDEEDDEDDEDEDEEDDEDEEFEDEEEEFGDDDYESSDGDDEYEYEYEYDEAAELAASSDAAGAEPVAEVVPAAPAAAKTTEPAREPAPSAAGGDYEQRLYDAGCLVLEENRVAVSMFQRRFEIDFDEACRMLDDLQERGLIGPYVGGRTRAILMTREEWLAPTS